MSIKSTGINKNIHDTYDEDEDTIPLHRRSTTSDNIDDDDYTCYGQRRESRINLNCLAWCNWRISRGSTKLRRTFQQRPLLRLTLLILTIFIFITSIFELRTGHIKSWIHQSKEAIGEVTGEFALCPELLAEFDRSRESNHPKGLNETTIDRRDGFRMDKSRRNEGGEEDWAQIIPASELIAMVQRGEKLPANGNIIHQSWKTRDNLPEYFDRWSKAWRKLHGRDWVYVLWLDDDNRKLIETFYPQYLETYNSLPREIYRIDMVRNAYMHRFGGVYADLDLVALSPLQDHLPILRRDRSSDSASIAYLGYMGDQSYLSDDSTNSDDSNSGSTSKHNESKGQNMFYYLKQGYHKLLRLKSLIASSLHLDNEDHSIPNAFMISTRPGHPFWMQTMEYVKRHQNNKKLNKIPETLTGPVALKKCAESWEDQESKRARERLGMLDELVVLRNGEIYPFSWYGSSQTAKCLCRLHSPYVNENKCNSLYPDAWTITYWTHSWG